MKTLSPTILLVGLVAALSVGCASAPPTVGDKMLTQSEGTRELAKQWQRGDALVKKGESIKAEGQEIIGKGDAKVKEGDRLIAEGTAMKKESEMIFKERFPGQTLDPTGN